jgi:hypothetical protein
MDDLRSGNPRTLGMHQEMAIRNIQRASAQETRMAVTREALNVSMVIATNAQSDVQLESFYEAETGGPWFSCLNHVTPRVGDMVVFTYLKGAPIVLGMIPNEFSSWRAPRTGLPDTFFFDDFEIGNVSAGGWLGEAKWTWATVSGSIALNAGSAIRPGHAALGAGNAATAYTYSHLLTNIMYLESLAEAEWMVQTNNAGQLVTGGLWQCGFTDHGLNVSQALVAMCDENQAGWGGNWCLMQSNPTTWVNMGDTGVKVVTNHWYKINFKRLGLGWWRLTVTDVTDLNVPIMGEVEAKGFQTTVAVTPWHRVYNRVANGEKWLSVDYVWWSRLGLKRG